MTSVEFEAASSGVNVTPIFNGPRRLNRGNLLVWELEVTGVMLDEVAAFLVNEGLDLDQIELGIRIVNDDNGKQTAYLQLMLDVTP